MSQLAYIFWFGVYVVGVILALRQTLLKDMWFWVLVSSPFFLGKFLLLYLQNYSRWESEYEKKSLANQPSPPRMDENEFIVLLAQEYQKRNPIPLNEAYLKQLFAYLTERYAIWKPDPERYLEICLEHLTKLTEHFPTAELNGLTYQPAPPRNPVLWDFVQDVYDTCPLSYEKLTPPLLPFEIPPHKRFVGTWVCAVSGKGKTNLLRHMILEDLKTDASVLILDSKGELLQSFADRGVVLNPPIPLNPLQIGQGIKNRELMEYLFGTLVESGEFTGLQQSLFRNVLILATAQKNATIHTIRDILIRGYKHYDLSSLREDRQQFFTTQFDSNQYKLTKEQILWRIENLITNDFMYQMLSTPKSELNLEQMVDSGSLILVNNNKDQIGDSGAEFLGRFFLALILNLAHSRTQRTGYKRPFFVYIDECQTVVRRDKKIETINDECRSQNIGLVLAHQRMNQMEVSVLDSLMNCGIKFLNVDQDTHNLATRIGMEKHQLTLPTGQFLCCVQDQSPATVNIPHVQMKLHPLPTARPMSRPAPPPPSDPKEPPTEEWEWGR